MSMLARLLQPACLPSLLHRSGAFAAISTSTTLGDLREIIPIFPKENEPQPSSGREWKAVDLRRKSWDDLHRLWFVLLKERNRLHSEKLAYTQARQRMPDPARLMKVRKSMNRIKQVMAQRISEHEDPTTKMYLKAFIDSM